jgi:hypothetical protein
VEGAGDNRSGDTRMADIEALLEAVFGRLPDLGLFSSAAEVPGFCDYENLD